jgi:hypothetical protein
MKPSTQSSIASAIPLSKPFPPSAQISRNLPKTRKIHLIPFILSIISSTIYNGRLGRTAAPAPTRKFVISQYGPWAHTKTTSTHAVEAKTQPGIDGDIGVSNANPALHDTLHSIRRERVLSSLNRCSSCSYIQYHHALLRIIALLRVRLDMRLIRLGLY